MKITFINNYKSIHPFAEVTSPEFCVFVGKNGAGKTHLLQAIANGHVSVDDLSRDNIKYFNLQSFLIKNQTPITIRNIEEQKMEAWRLFDSWRNQKIINEDSERIMNRIKGQTEGNPKIRALLVSGIFLSGVSPKDLDETTFLKYAEFNPDDYYLINSLSEICIDYHLKYLRAKLPAEQGGEGKNSEELEEIERSSPWNFINNMFHSFGLSHKITAPSFNAGDILNSSINLYEAKPLIEDFEVGFDDLSSGEKILCALAITVYQDQKTTAFPKLLLLDEVDASLHPSMIKNLLNVINDTFLKNNCKVILATHSPTTASLVKEESVYEIKPGKVNEKIVKISHVDAVDILSEGMITLEKGLTLFDDISKKELSIITEGDNIQHFKKAIEILDPDLLSKVELINGVEGSSGEQQLKTIFDFFSKIPHKNSVIVVLDCDVNLGKRMDNENTFIFALPKNDENTLANKGIENIYPATVFSGFVNTERESSGKTIEKFDQKRKKDFLQKILTFTSKAEFENYLSFIQKLKSILTAK